MSEPHLRYGPAHLTREHVDLCRPGPALQLLGPPGRRDLGVSLGVGRSVLPGFRALNPLPSPASWRADPDPGSPPPPLCLAADDCSTHCDLAHGCCMPDGSCRYPDPLLPNHSPPHQHPSHPQDTEWRALGPYVSFTVLQQHVKQAGCPLRAPTGPFPSATLVCFPTSTTSPSQAWYRDSERCSSGTQKDLEIRARRQGEDEGNRGGPWEGKAAGSSTKRLS